MKEQLENNRHTADTAICIHKAYQFTKLTIYKEEYHKQLAWPSTMNLNSSLNNFFYELWTS